MAKHQTRRGISIKGSSYRHLKAHCDARGISMSSWLEEEIVEKLGPAPAPSDLDDGRETGIGQELDETRDAGDDDGDEAEPEDRRDKPARPKPKRPLPERTERATEGDPPELAGYVPPIKLL